jgi:hypothetical protein
MVRSNQLVVLPVFLLLTVTTVVLGACSTPGQSDAVPGPAVIFVYTDN